MSVSGGNLGKDESEGIQANWKQLKESYEIQAIQDQERRKMLDKEIADFQENHNLSLQRKNVVLEKIKVIERSSFEASEALKARKEKAENLLGEMSDVERKRNAVVGLFEFINKQVNIRKPLLNENSRRMEETCQKAFAKIELAEKNQDDIRERFKRKEEQMDKSNEEMDRNIKIYQEINERMREGIEKASKAIERFSSAITKCKADVQEGTKEYQKNADERALFHQEESEKVRRQRQNMELENEELLRKTTNMAFTNESNLSEIASLELSLSCQKKRYDEEETFSVKVDEPLNGYKTEEQIMISDIENQERLQEGLRKSIREEEKALLEIREVKKQVQNEVQQFAQCVQTLEEDYRMGIEKQEKNLVELKAECLKYDEKRREMELSIEGLRRDKQMAINNKAKERMELLSDKLENLGKILTKNISKATDHLEKEQETIRDRMNSNISLVTKTRKEYLENEIKDRKEILQKKLEECGNIKVTCDSKMKTKTELADEIEKLKLIIEKNIAEIEALRKEIKEEEENTGNDLVDESKMLDEQLKEEDNLNELLDDKYMSMREMCKETSLLRRANYCDNKRGMTKYVRKTPQKDGKENRNGSANNSISGIEEGYDSAKNKVTPHMKENRSVPMKIRSAGNEAPSSKERLMTPTTSFKRSSSMGGINSMTPKFVPAKKSLVQTGNKRKMCKEKNDAKGSSTTEVNGENREPDKSPEGPKRLFVPGTFGM